MSLECAVFIVGVIIQVTAFSSWVQIMMGRFVSGLGVGGLSAAVPMVCSCSLTSFKAASDLSNLLAVPSRNSPASDSRSYDVSGFNPSGPLI